MQLKRTIKDWVGQIKEVIATFMDCTSMSKQSQKKRFKWETWGIKEDLKKLYIRVITKLPNTEQSSKGKVKTHKSINKQNLSTTGKLVKPQWPWLGTGISKEMVDWIRSYDAKPLTFITVQRFRLSL